MSYYWSCKTERVNYKASCIKKFYYCSKADDIIQMDITPSGMYRDCEKCKSCSITDTSETYNQINFLEGHDFDRQLFYALELSNFVRQFDPDNHNT